MAQLLLDKIAYRTLRTDVLAQHPPEPSRSRWRRLQVLRNPDGKPNGKERIRAFREAVADQADCYPAEFVARALGLPFGWQTDYAPAAGWRRVYLWLRKAFWKARLQQSLISGIRTYEGRAFALGRATARADGSGGEYLSPERDFLLRRFGYKAVAAMDTAIRDDAKLQQLRPLNVLDVFQLRIGWHLGLHSASELAPFAQLLRTLPRGVLAAWQFHGLLSSTDDLKKIEPVPHALSHPAIEGEDARIGWSLYRLITSLRQAGATAEALATVNHLDGHLRPIPTGTLALMARYGWGTDLALSTCGARLWRCEPENWRFVIETIGASTPSAAAKFRTLLDCSPKALNAAAVDTLRTRGLTTGELEVWQRWLCTHDSRFRPPTGEHLDQLLASGLALADLPSVPELLDSGKADRFQKFFKTAQTLDASSSADLCALAPTLGVRNWKVANEILPMRQDFGNPSLRVWGSFVRTFVDGGGRSDSLKFLQRTYRLADLNKANAIHQLGRLDIVLLTYMYEAGGCTTFQALAHWYYKGPGTGAGAIRLGSLPESIERCILDEAARAKVFATVAPCLGILHEVLWWESRTRDVTIESLSEILRPRLPTLLRDEGGLIAPSLIREALRPQPDFINVRQRLRNQRQDLIDCRGPITATIDKEQQEAIASAYRVDQAVVASHWPSVHGTQGRVKAFASEDALHRPVTWRRMSKRLKEPLPHSQRDALSLITSRARAWQCGATPPRLAAKKLSEASASLETVADHIALLQAIASIDPTVAAATERWERLFTDPDAVDEEIGWVRDLVAEHWRLALAATPRGPLIDAAAIATGLPEHIEPKAILKSLLTSIEPVLDRWIASVEARSSRTPVQPRQLLASVTTTPAAFFARASAHLCTADKVGMWLEDRHAHVVVFDPEMGTLEGMAMLYLERIPEISPRKRTVILRAINLPVSLREVYDIDDVITSLLDVARSVAVAGDHAGPALPGDTGQDLLSNDQKIRSRLMARLKSNQFRHIDLKTPFYGYANGDARGAAKALWIMETGAVAPITNNFGGAK